LSPIYKCYDKTNYAGVITKALLVRCCCTPSTSLSLHSEGRRNDAATRASIRDQVPRVYRGMIEMLPYCCHNQQMEETQPKHAMQVQNVFLNQLN
jgi:hypothetical protein